MATFSFTASNVFQSWDLNPLAAATGIPRDTLAAMRDSFLQPKFAAYRQLAVQRGFKAAEDDYSLFFDPDFRAYVQTGAVPDAGYVTPPPPVHPTVYPSQLTPQSTQVLATADDGRIVANLTGASHTSAQVIPTGQFRFAGATAAPSLFGFDSSTLLIVALAVGAYLIFAK